MIPRSESRGERPGGRLAEVDLLSYWNLNERPFEAVWDRRFYYRSAAHEEALSRLRWVASEEGLSLGLVTGEIGCGKTLIRAMLTEELGEDYEVVLLENSAFGFGDLLGSILRSLGAEREGGASKIVRYETLRRVAREIHQDDRHLILIFDEAQEMTPATLNELKLLTNINGEGESCLTLILLGQPELRRKVASLPAIDQRVGLRFHLWPLDLEETSAYLSHRLRVAGHTTGQIFTDEAVEGIFEYSGGIPRETNRFAKLALELSWLKDLPVVTSAAVRGVIRDWERQKDLHSA